MDEPTSVRPPERTTSGSSSRLEFDRYTIALLILRPDAPQLDEEAAAALQDAHLAHLADLHEAGHLLAPVSEGVQFRFTALGRGGAWQIDDDYVDPFKER